MFLYPSTLFYTIQIHNDTSSARSERNCTTLHPVPPTPPQDQRCAASKQRGRGADPERRSPALYTHARGFIGCDMSRGDEGVQVREDGCADECGVRDDAEVATEVLETPDGGEDPWTAGMASEFVDIN